jgi:KUP system potassium uptake protein
VIAAFSRSTVFLGANLPKIQHGGWFRSSSPGYSVMSTWTRAGGEPAPRKYRSTRSSAAGAEPARARGLAPPWHAPRGSAPPILVHHLKHNKVLHQQIVR